MTRFGQDPIFTETGLWVLGLLFISAIPVYIFRKKNHYFVASWASIKSWLLAAPIMLLVFSLPEPWVLVIVTITALSGTKVLFQLMGLYHRHWFVLSCYLAIVGLAFAIHYERLDLYNLLPMIMLGCICLIPIFKNSYKRMVQYIGLTLLCFMFLGWA